MRQEVDKARIVAFMETLGTIDGEHTRVYLTGGATAVIYGWRATTIDIDLHMVPETDALQRAIPELKERFSVNVEFVSPAHFIPVPDGWEERSIYVAHSGHVSVYHFDLYAQALAKLERGHQRDLADVRAMFERNLIDASRLTAYFEAVVPSLYKYPAIDPADFREAVNAFVHEHARGHGPSP